MISDVPLGAFLSGGVDSSTVVALMSQVLDQPVKTLSVAFEEQEFDETDYAQIVANRFGTDHHKFYVSGSDVAQEMEEIMAAMDQPTGDGINTYFISKMARKAGLKVVLSGLGGDELFCGYSSFRRVPKLKRLMSAWNLLPTRGQKALTGLLKQKGWGGTAIR